MGKEPTRKRGTEDGKTPVPAAIEGGAGAAAQYRARPPSQSTAHWQPTGGGGGRQARAGGRAEDTQQNAQGRADWTGFRFEFGPQGVRRCAVISDL